MDIKNLGCINPYTGLLTSKKVTNVDKLGNSIDIAEGAKVTVEGGFVLTVGKEIVDISGGDLYNRKASEKAAEMASALIMLLRNAGGTANSSKQNL